MGRSERALNAFAPKPTRSGSAGAIVVATRLFKRGPPPFPLNRRGRLWQETGKRCVDSTIGQIMMVRYNPQTAGTTFR